MENLEKISQKFYKHFLLVLILVAFFLRAFYINNNAISFAFDQARDAFVVGDLLSGNLKILGPSVSGIPGLYHGVLYYYVIAIPYFIGHGNPQFVAYFLSFVSSLILIPVFILAKLLTKKYFPSLLAGLFFAFSFELSQYSNLLTNASLGVWFVPLIYIAIILESPILLGLSFGLSVQSELALLYHAIPIIALTYKKYNLKKYMITLFTFLVSISSLLISEFKFGFQGIRGLIYLFNGGDGISAKKMFSDYILTVLNQLSLTFSFTIFPTNVVFGGLVGFLLLIYLLRRHNNSSKLLLWYILSFVIALPFGGWNMKHILVGVAPAVCVALAIFINENIFKYKLFLLLFIIIVLFTNTVKILNENINGQTIFPLQEDLVLSKELRLIDYTYQKANYQPFSISTLTSPLYVNTLWSYLYNWYGKEKYGYLPSFIGHDQVGQLGNNLISDDKGNRGVQKHFYIEEPTYGIPEIYVQYQRGDENSISTLVDSKYFGQLMVEERNIIK